MLLVLLVVVVERRGASESDSSSESRVERTGACDGSEKKSAGNPDLGGFEAEVEDEVVVVVGSSLVRLFFVFSYTFKLFCGTSSTSISISASSAFRFPLRVSSCSARAWAFAASCWRSQSEIWSKMCSV